MDKVFLVMFDIETVDRAFSTREKARTYVRTERQDMAYYKAYPEKLTTETIDVSIQECKLD